MASVWKLRPFSIRLSICSLLDGAAALRTLRVDLDSICFDGHLRMWHCQLLKFDVVRAALPWVDLDTAGNALLEAWFCDVNLVLTNGKPFRRVEAAVIRSCVWDTPVA